MTITNGPDALGGRDPLGGVIKTTGDWSHGIVAQSIGAGGGKASTIYGTASYYYPDLAVQLGGSEGTGNGGTISGTLTGGFITTGTSDSGYSAFGFVAQPIGGGGGIFGNYAGSTGSISSSGTRTSNGTITLTQAGSVTANGQNSIGIFAQNTTPNHSGNTVTVNVNGAASGATAGIWIADDNNNNVNSSHHQ